MTYKKTGVLLINLGTPDSPSFFDVAKYLFEFLNDPRVIDIPAFFRFLLVNFIIVPFRSRGSSKIYGELWTERGSPLLYNTQDLAKKLQIELDNSYEVFFAMRYNKPSIATVLEKMRRNNFSKITILPLYPQYASSSSGTAIEKVLKIIAKWYTIPEIEVKGQFYDNPLFIDAIIENTKGFNIKEYDHVLFSYHGLPISHVDDAYIDGDCADEQCEKSITTENQFCYKAASFETTRLITEKLNLPKEKYTIAFQSRLNDKWLKPYADVVVKDLAVAGAKKILVLSPAFTSDCLETTIEIGSEYKEIFKENGGKQLDLVPSLNSNDAWVKAIKDMII